MMEHFDEYILELYVLNAPESRDRRDAIEEHVKVCWGCRLLVEQLREFHQDLETALQDRTTEGVSAKTTALAQPRTYLQAASPYPSRPIFYGGWPLLNRFGWFVRRHPIVTGASALGFAALAGFLLNMALWKNAGRAPVNDRNPAYSMYNLQTRAMEILNKEDQLLWQMKLADPEKWTSVENGSGTHSTAICDLDGDGKNEVLTLLPFIDMPDSNRGHLRILDGNRNLLRDIRPREAVRYKNRQDEYSPYFNLSSLLCRRAETGKSEIFAVGSSIGRSPAVVFRFDHEGKTIGEYWHFGQFVALFYGADDPASGRKLLAGGTNDTKDVTHEEYPVVAALLPDKILGQRKASACPDYLMEPSAAELFYIRIPASDLDSLFHTHGIVTRIVDHNDSLIEVTVTSSSMDGTVFDFHYYFDHALQPVFVKSNNQTDAIHQKLAIEHRLKGLVDRPYLENLRTHIQYWNGSEWVRHYAVVNHRLAVSGS